MFEAPGALPLIIIDALSLSEGSSQKVCKAKIIINKIKTVLILFLNPPVKSKIRLITMKKISTLFKAANTVRPTSNPTSRESNGAVNLTGASIKLIAHMKPNQIKVITKE
jgi:hypothetical protein